MCPTPVLYPNTKSRLSGSCSASTAAAHDPNRYVLMRGGGRLMSARIGGLPSCSATSARSAATCSSVQPLALVDRRSPAESQAAPNTATGDDEDDLLSFPEDDLGDSPHLAQQVVKGVPRTNCTGAR